MITFRKFLQEDFKSSQIIELIDRNVTIPVSYEKMPFKSFNLMRYLMPFTKDKTIMTGGMLRGVIFKYENNFFNICWEDYLHTKILTLLKEKISNIDFIDCYKKMNSLLTGNTIPEFWGFTYFISKSSLGTTLRRDVIEELEKQKNVNTLFGFTDLQWKRVKDNAD